MFKLNQKAGYWPIDSNIRRTRRLATVRARGIDHNSGQIMQYAASEEFGEELTTMSLFHAFLVWLIIIGFEIGHGILRSLLLMPVVGDFRARQISVFTGSVLIFGVAYVFIDWIQAKNRKELILVGLMWVLLTVIFEVVLGRLVLGLPWTRITEDYDLPNGGLLGLGLLFMTAAPSLAQSLRRRVKKPHSV